MGRHGAVSGEIFEAVVAEADAAAQRARVARGDGHLVPARTGLAGRWRREPCEVAAAAARAVDEALQVPPLQRLALARVTEMEIRETDDALEVVQLIPLNGVGACIRRGVCYPKTGGAVQGPRRDARPGVTRSLLTVGPKGHVHIRAFQEAPHAAVFHERLKLSVSGAQLKVEQKSQLLDSTAGGAAEPIKHHCIWHRV
ncbi:hypothetical protein WJX81_004661 [Elliptochloris bilobata]|uniref:Uncharacterized protein n=1 Tax=Elliptochloris bilobata TaxID=381761 RepID=A0AAW1SKU6_9CHLO